MVLKLSASHVLRLTRACWMCYVTCQMAKDVTTFLAWAAEPEHDDRKLMGAKWIFVLSLVMAQAVYYKRWKWSPIKSRRIVIDPIN
eukprot:2274786-Pyramimonas_sp.AAC.1